MLFVLSPAKSLDYESPLPPDLPHTDPPFPDRSARLAAALRRKSARQLSALMDISADLATLNARRWRDWVPEPGAANARQAVFAFDGDVYEGLRARELSTADLDWAQGHVRMLSGLYGVLRPLDRIQPYRLEMGTALPVGTAKNLYAFWGRRIADRLRADLVAQKTPVLVNLASQEYFRSVDLRALGAAVVECVFEDARGDGPHKVISFFAKKARGMMARHAIIHRVETPVQLQEFGAEGYRYSAEASTPGRLVFRRRIEP